MQQQPNMQQQTQESDDVGAYYPNEMGSMFSDSFSFLDSDDTKEGTPISHNFEFLGETSNSINTPDESGSMMGGNSNQSLGESVKGKGSSEYDRLLQERDTEFQSIQRI